MNESMSKSGSPDWDNVRRWAPLFKKRKQMEKEIIGLEAEKTRIENATISREETKERLRDGEIDEVAKDMAIKCATGEDLHYLVDGNRAVQAWAKAALITKAVEVIDEMKDGDWPADALSQQEKVEKVKKIELRIKKLKKDLELANVEDKSLVVYDEYGQPVGFRPDDWIKSLAEEIRQTGPARDDEGNARYSSGKMKAIELLGEFLS